MPASLTGSRNTPRQAFEDYTVSYVSSQFSGLTKNAGSAFNVFTGSLFTGSFGPTSIGFDFRFNEVTYKNIFMSSQGFVVLVDPAATASFSMNDVSIISGQDQEINNSHMRVEGFDANHVVLAPWWDNQVLDGNDFNDPFGQTEAFEGQLAAARRNIYALTTRRDSEFNYGLQYLVQESYLGRRLVIRWNSRSSFGTSIYLFECVIYENGTIEFRYGPENASDPTSEINESGKPWDIAASCGIFACRTPYRFRDFSPYLNYKFNDVNVANIELTKPPLYISGGFAYNGIHFDDDFEASIVAGVFPDPRNPGDFISARPYAVNLRAYRANWPGTILGNGMFVFSPPKHKAKILPKKRYNKTKLPKTQYFNDSNIVAFTSASTSCSFPCRFSFFAGAIDEAGANRQQFLFRNDIKTTGSFTKGVSDEFSDGISAISFPLSNPFTDSDRYAQSNDSVFFTSGTDEGTVAPGFNQKLKSKTQIRLQLEVQSRTRIHGATASILYYSATEKFWLPPRRSTPFAGGVIFTPTDWAKPSMYRDFKVFSEDAKMFGALGNTVASGSRTISLLTQSIAYINQPITNQTLAVSDRHEKNVQLTSSYASSGEHFTIPIDKPFLLEKLVIELPIRAGNGWFKDKTTVGRPFDATGSYNTTYRNLDVGGPALTVALFNQQGVGGITKLDLIASGTVTHQFDNISQVRVFKDPGMRFYQARSEGMLAHGATPCAVIIPTLGSNLSYSFTGSVQLNMVPGVSNGVVAAYERDLEGLAIKAVESGSLFALNYDNQLSAMFTAHTLNVNKTTYSRLQISGATDSVNAINIYQIDSMGRASTGFAQCGRSIFGKEFVGPRLVNERVNNPLFVSSSVSLLPSSIRTHITSGDKDLTNFFSAIQVRKTVDSPYLLLPNDKLILAISKFRPVLYSFGTSSLGVTVTEFSGTSGHDVVLDPGNINMTLYGSYVQENEEFHTVNQLLDTEDFHDAIIEPVLDQFEVDYQSSYLRGTYDDYITGTMIRKISNSGDTRLVTGSRGLSFSKIANNVLPQADFDVFDFPYDQETLQYSTVSEAAVKRFEKIGMLGINQSFSTSERYYDTLLPSITSVIQTNGGTAFASAKINEDLGIESSSLNERPTKNIGYVHLNCSSSCFPSTDAKWNFSFPFEPKYSTIKRELDVNKTLTGKILKRDGSDFIPNEKVIFDGIVFILFGDYHFEHDFGFISSLYVNSPFTWVRNYLFDVFIINSSATELRQNSAEDTLKIFYGIGDQNTLTYETTPASGSLVGTTNLVDFRVKAGAFQISISPKQRGWKYGVYNALPEYTKIYHRRGRYGQFRDMLEQRKDAKFSLALSDSGLGIGTAVTTSPVQVKFINPADGKLTNPELTWSQNLSNECTSSVPYFDNETRNRGEIDVTLLNNVQLTI